MYGDESKISNNNFCSDKPAQANLLSGYFASYFYRSPIERTEESVSGYGRCCAYLLLHCIAEFELQNTTILAILNILETKLKQKVID